jgi:release factor glutamine methyltransferase
MTEKKETWTVKRVLEWTRSYLGEKGVENARREAEWLLAHSLATDRVGLYVQYEKPLTEAELAAFRGLVVRRARREPLQYILGTQEFAGLDFEVAPGVLIPRHDTEVLVEEAARIGGEANTVLDIGTGSGCVAIALAKRLPKAKVVSVDPSTEALSVAGRNACRAGVSVDFVEGSLFEPFPGREFDMIVSNPPYIPSGEIPTLQPEVRDFEPQTALDGGEDGLDFYRAISSGAPAHLRPGGCLLLEVGIGQSVAVIELLRRHGFIDLFTANDPGGIDRVVGGKIS